MVLMLQATLTLGWAAGVVPTAAMVAPLPAVAVYIAAAAAVSRKLRPRELGLFLPIIIVLAGSVPASFIQIPAEAMAPIASAIPDPMDPSMGAARDFAVSNHRSPAVVMASPIARAAESAATTMACAALALVQSNGVPSRLMPGCGIKLAPALQEQLAEEGD